MKKLLTMTAGAALLCAYLVNTTSQFLQYDKYLSSINFWVFWMVTYILLWVYMFWMTAVHYLCFIYNRHSEDNVAHHFYGKIKYMAMAVAPVLIFHLSMLHIVFMQQHHTLWDSGYLFHDFIFLIVPVVLYAIMLYRTPERAIFYTIVQKWMERLMDFFLTYHRPREKEKVVMVFPSAASEDNTAMLLAPQPAKPAINFIKLLFLEFKTQSAVFYTVYGERITVALTSTAIKNWIVSDWFVQIRRGFYVNMWHVRHGMRSKYQLQLEPNVQQLFLEGLQIEESALQQMLQVSKDLKKNIAQHFIDRDQLTRDGWDETFYD